MKIGVFKGSIILVFILVIGFVALWTMDNYYPFDGPSDNNSTPVRLVFVGDVMLSRGIGDITANKDPKFPFEHVRSFLQRGDITVGNLESPISDTNTTRCEKDAHYCFKTSSESVYGLVDAGFDAMTGS